MNAPARRLPVIGTAVLLAVLGCSPSPVEPPGAPEAASTTSSDAPAAPTAAQVTWADTVCAIDRALVGVSGSQSKAGAGWVDAPGTHRAAIVAFLTDVDNRLKALQQQVSTLTPSPFTGGDAVAAAYRDTIDPLQATIADHASHAAVFPPEGVAAAFRLTLVELVTFEVDAPGLEDDPLYARARGAAPNCAGG